MVNGDRLIDRCSPDYFFKTIALIMIFKHAYYYIVNIILYIIHT